MFFSNWLRSNKIRGATVSHIGSSSAYSKLARIIFILSRQTLIMRATDQTTSEFFESYFSSRDRKFFQRNFWLNGSQAEDWNEPRTFRTRPRRCRRRPRNRFRPVRTGFAEELLQAGQPSHHRRHRHRPLCHGSGEQLSNSDNSVFNLAKGALVPCPRHRTFTLFVRGKYHVQPTYCLLAKGKCR